MKEKIIQYWHNLQPREQKILIAGGVFLILFLLYYILSSGTGRSAQMAQQVEREQQLLTWMQPVVAQIVMSRTQVVGDKITPQNILPQVELSLAHAGLSGYVSALNLEADQVRIEFNDVVYESLVDWLYAFSRQGAIVREFSVTKSEEVGVVQANILITAG